MGREERWKEIRWRKGGEEEREKRRRGDGGEDREKEQEWKETTKCVGLRKHRR